MTCDTDFDLATLDVAAGAERGAVLTLLHPVSREPLSVRIWLQGTDAPAYRAAVRQQIDQQIADGKADLTAVEMEERHIQRLAAITLKWEHVKYRGKDLDCTTGNVERLYREQVWVREQVTRFTEDRSRFLGG